MTTSTAPDRATFAAGLRRWANGDLLRTISVQIMVDTDLWRIMAHYVTWRTQDTARPDWGDLHNDHLAGGPTGPDAGEMSPSTFFLFGLCADLAGVQIPGWQFRNICRLDLRNKKVVLRALQQNLVEGW